MSAVSVPDELVEAAAEALCREAHGPGALTRRNGSCERCKCASRLALQAAFAELPECEAALRATSDPPCLDPNVHNSCKGVPWVHPVCALAALAREFGGRK